MSDRIMNCIMEIDGSLCGVKTTLCGGYVNNDFLLGSVIKIDNKGLHSLIKVLGNTCEQAVSPFIDMLDDFQVDLKFNYSKSKTVIEINTDALKFVGYDGQGKFVWFNLSFRELISNHANNMFFQIVNGVNTFFGIKTFSFLYRSNNITNNILYKAYDFLPQIPYNIKNSVVICGNFCFDEIAESKFSWMMKELFGINEMNVYLGADRDDISCLLVVPDLKNSFISCRNIMIGASFGRKNVSFFMEGTLALTCFSGMEFCIKSEFTLTSVSISASSMPTNTYTIPCTPFSICNSGLEIGASEKGLSFSMMTQINVRRLMWYGALRLSYQGATVTLDMLSMAMSKLSFSSLAENLIGLSGDRIKSLDIIEILPFDLKETGAGNKIDFRNKSDEEIINMVNHSLMGMKDEFLLSEDVASITRMPDNKACDILNRNTMFHYWVDENGELSFPPQAYYSTSHISIGKYNFEKGIFFCAKVVLFKQSLKIMFSALDGNGMIGFAQMDEIDMKFLKISGSTSSRNMGNPVLGNVTNSTLTLLAGDFYEDKSLKNPATAYVSISRNSCEFYVDGHFELCSVFSFDTMMYLMDKRVCISVEISYFNMIRASLYLKAAYDSFTSGGFEFAVLLDCKGLHDKVVKFTRMIDDAVVAFNDKIQNAKLQIDNARNKVSSLQRDIDSYYKRIGDCKSTIRRTSRWKRWWVAIREGAKIAYYETVIVGIQASMFVAQQALNIAEKTLDISGKLGSGMLNAINSVIKGALDAFYFNSAALRILVQGINFKVEAHIDMHILGKDIQSDCVCDLSQLAKKPIAVIEDCLIERTKDLLDRIRSGEYEYVEIGEPQSYHYMDLPENVVDIANLANYGAERIIGYQSMIEELSNTYIMQMKEFAPEFEACDTQLKEAACQVSYIMDNASQNTYVDGMDEMMSILKTGIDKKELSGEDIQIAQECINQYLTEIRPANSIVSEAASQVRQQTDQMDANRQFRYLRSVRKDTEQYTGNEILESKDYDKLYNEVEAIVTKYFPPGSGKGYINFTDEEKFYEMLNEAREDSGCNCIPAQMNTENNTLKLQGLRTSCQKEYIPRFD